MVAQSTLVLHCGARHVDVQELAAVKTPPAEGRWHPVSHVAVVRRVKQTLAEAGYAVRRQQLGLSPIRQLDAVYGPGPVLEH